MRHLDGIYTQRFNRAHGTDGPLFRGRFKSILVEKDSYLLELVRYIHLNPVKIGICRTPAGHRWTSHHAYLHPRRRPGWLVVDEVLSQFGKRYAKAAVQFDRFVKAGASEELDRKLGGKKLPSVLGSEGFRDWVKHNYIRILRSNREIPQARRAMRCKVPLRAIIRHVAVAYGVKRGDVLTRGRPVRNEPRAMATYLMRRIAGASHREISEEMRGVGTAAIAKTIQRFECQIKRNETLREKAEVFTRSILSNVRT